MHGTHRLVRLSFGLPLAGMFAALTLAACNNDDRVGDGVLRPPDTSVGTDTTPDTTDIEIVKLEAGEPCTSNDACASGLCLDVSSGGKICSSVCTAESGCPNGLTCVVDGEAGLCVKTDVVSCQPCKADDDCNVGGLAGNKCVPYGDEGSFCGNACTTNDNCPIGYECAEGGGCKKQTGQCQCNAAGIKLGAETTCAVTNEFGSCEGLRGCGAAGLSRCLAETPAAEVCNGRDDNCDGETDEGTSGAECDLTNEYGTCKGAVACTTGRPLCVGRAPAKEVCNGIDDNCDGHTDEGSPDGDEDGIPDCLDDDWDNDETKNVDDCQPHNAAVHPGAADVCNGVDDDCDHGIDNGEAAGCGCYVCAGEAGCLTECDSNADVDAGYVCDTGDFDDDGDRHECIESVCGNGEVEAGEVCDDGENVGAYGGCFACIELGPYCGDGRRQYEFELCDDGPLNGETGHCNATCDGKTGPRCGDGVPDEGEECDLGTNNSDAPNASCRKDCRFARCGDGIVDSNNEEACDAGAANGTSSCGCNAGCFYPSAEVVCRNAAGACDVAETCNGQGQCAVDKKLSGTTCREAGGVCDVAETCDGVSNACPADAKAAKTKVCRDSVGSCDVVDTCDGTNNACPADAVKSSSTECRAANGLCDVAEKCDGTHGACPGDAFKIEGTECRATGGLCDVAERCTGLSAACPVDKLKDNGTVCHASGGGCDKTVTCNGTTAACAYTGVEKKDTVCRAATGLCDAAEVCDGVAATCPSDKLATEGTTCRGAAGPCDAVEKCDGTTAQCPDDSFFGHDVTCRESAGGCDFPETCDGNNTACPADVVAEAGVVCHQATGACDQNATCNGTDGTCDYGGLLPEGTTCRVPWGDCDVAEKCDGSSDQCPADALADNTTVCRPAAGGCDVADSCTGYSHWCPYNQLAGEGTLCREGAGFCNPSEYCSGASVDCPTDFVQQNGTDCTDTNECNSSSCVCQTGTCANACGNGTVEGIERCDDGEANGQKGRCNETCDAPCGNDATWMRRGGGYANDLATSVAVGGDGTSFAAGSYQVANLPTAPTFFDVEFGNSYFLNNGGNDVFVMATDASNAPLWAACATGPSNDIANAVAQDGDGVWVVGEFHNRLTFGCCDAQNLPAAAGLGCPSVDAGDGSSDTRSDVFVARYDQATGALLWASHGGTWYQDDYGSDIAASAGGRAVVVGSAVGTASSAQFGPLAMTVTGGADGFAVGYGPNGDPRWLVRLGGSDGADYADHVAMDGEGNAYVVGEYFGTPMFGTITLPTSGPGDVYVAKISPDGAVLWVKAINDNVEVLYAPVTRDVAYGCVPSAAGAPVCSVYLAVNDEQTGASFLFDLAPSDGLITRWSAVDAGLSIEGLAVDRAGALYATGYFEGEAHFASRPVASMSSAGGVDGFVARRAADGSWSWAKRFGGAGVDVGAGIGLGDDGSLWVAGGFSQTATFDGLAVLTYSEQLGGGLDGDAFVAKLPPSTDGCFVCGDGTTDPGEACDDAERTSCGGTCDGICSGPANTCGDGWAECGEDYDLASGSADAGMCTAVYGDLWCFRRLTDVAEEFTLYPVDPTGAQVVFGTGIVSSSGANLAAGEFVGNPNTHADCPEVQNESSLGYAQWRGDTLVGASGTSPLYCDGDAATAPTTTAPTNTMNLMLAAAVECGDYYEFRASTGPSVAFEFDDRSGTDGPTTWGLYASLTGQAGTFERVGAGVTNGPGVGAWGTSIFPPQTIVYLDGVTVGGKPLTNQDVVYFRLYGAGANSVGGVWVVDNVRVGTPTVPKLTGNLPWINEMHYDNTGTDTGEFVEVVFPPDVSTSGWRIVSYNGSPTQNRVYDIDLLAGTPVDAGNGFKIITLDNVFQNGASSDTAVEADGMALLSPYGQLVQFISYEGGMTPWNGPAVGVASTDIGVKELTTTPVGQSLQLHGTGCSYSDFTWAAPATATKGLANTSQTFQCGAAVP